MLTNLSATGESLRIATNRRSLMAVATESVKDTYVVLAQPKASVVCSEADRTPRALVQPPISSFTQCTFDTARAAPTATPFAASIVSSPVSIPALSRTSTQVLTVTPERLPPPLLTASLWKPSAGAPSVRSVHPTGQTFFGGIPGLFRRRAPSRFTPKILRRKTLLGDKAKLAVAESSVAKPRPKRRESMLKLVKLVRKLTIRRKSTLVNGDGTDIDRVLEGSVAGRPVEPPTDLVVYDEDLDETHDDLTHHLLHAPLFTPLPPRTPPLRRMVRTLGRPIRVLRNKLRNSPDAEKSSSEHEEQHRGFREVWGRPLINRLKPATAHTDPDLTLALAVFLVLAFTNACALTLLPPSRGLYGFSGITMAVGALFFRPSLWPLLHHSTSSRRGAACAILAFFAALLCLVLELTVVLLKVARIGVILEAAIRSTQEWVAKSLAEALGPCGEKKQDTAPLVHEDVSQVHP